MRQPWLLLGRCSTALLHTGNSNLIPIDFLEGGSTKVPILAKGRALRVLRSTSSGLTPPAAAKSALNAKGGVIRRFNSRSRHPHYSLDLLRSKADPVTILQPLPELLQVSDLRLFRFP